ncbi:MAG: UDP-N-acetylmuramate dehydrogenase [Alphaproteobacteria bacterium]
MRAAPRDERLVERLPRVRGRYTENAPLGRFTWFRAGGTAEILFRPADEADLVAFLRARPADVQLTVVGLGSNLLVRDGGVDGVVIRLSRAFAGIEVEGVRVSAGAAALDLSVARVCGKAGVGGLEFLSGVPGTIGGALRMNAGAYGRAMKDVTVAASALDGRGQRHELAVSDLDFFYRGCAVPEDWIFTAATLNGEVRNSAEIAVAMADIATARTDTQPLRTRTGGSTFVNPPGHKAWQLIERAGYRGLRRGGAMVSDKHCNFLINTGSATADDIEALGEEVRHRVAEATGIALEWEIRRIGRPAFERIEGGGR